MSDVQSVARLAHVRGTVRVPGDKSASHRALMLSALADGVSSIEGLSNGEDVAATAQIVRALGAHVDFHEERTTVTGPSEGLSASSGVLDCENSGTAMRLFCGLLGGVPGEHRLVGDASLSARPMDRVANPLAEMGVVVEGVGEQCRPPLVVHGVATPRAIDYTTPVASAQVKSAVLFAGLSADGPVVVRESVPTRTTTEDMMREAGLGVDTRDEGLHRVVTLRPGRPRPTSWRIPGDPSQAAFFVVLASIHPDASLSVIDLDLSPERAGFVRVLQRMGADIAVRGDEHHGELVVTSSRLSGTEVLATEIPSLDEVPALVVAACAATGETVFRAVGELRVKESDRFAASIALATSLGASAHGEGDDLYVTGLGSASSFAPCAIDAGLDHRLVMAAAVAGASGNGARLQGAATVNSSYPHFFRDLGLLGG